MRLGSFFRGAQAKNTTSSKKKKIVTPPIVAPTTFPTTVNALLLKAPIISLDVSRTTFPIKVKLSNLQYAQVGDTLWIKQANNAAMDSGVVYYAHTVTQEEATASVPRNITFTGFAALSSGTHRFQAFLQRANERSGPGNIITHGPNDVAPLISVISIEAETSTTAVGSILTNGLDGDVYYLATTSITPPSEATMLTADSFSVTSVGIYPIELSGLEGEETYYLHVMHVPDVGPTSIINTSDVFVTPQASVFSYAQTDARTGDGSGSGNVITYTNVDIGAAAADRVILIHAIGYIGGGIPDAPIVNGIASTRIESLSGNMNWVFRSLVPLGTTCTIVLNNWFNQNGITVYRLTGVNPTPTIQYSGQGWTNAPRSVGTTNIAGDCVTVLFGAAVSPIVTDVVWTGATERNQVAAQPAIPIIGFSATSEIEGTQSVSVSGLTAGESSLMSMRFTP